MQSKMPLDGLVSAFGAGVIALHVGKWGRPYGARLELSRSGHVGSQENAERLVRQFVGLVRALPRSKRKLWRDALTREFNIGIQAAPEARPFEFRFEPATLR